MFILACGCIAKKQGQEDIGVFLIMSSLYATMWIHAGLTGSVFERKLREREEQKQN